MYCIELSMSEFSIKGKMEEECQLHDRSESSLGVIRIFFRFCILFLDFSGDII
jgi:hypothetical protein